MASKSLVKEDIESGKRLVQKLDEEGVPVDAALWMYDPESEQYRLVIGSGDVDQNGARPIYVKIQTVLKALPEEHRVRFSDIAVTSPSTGVVATLGRAISTSSIAITSIRITNTVVNRELIDDAYVYRMSVRNPEADSSVVQGQK